MLLSYTIRNLIARKTSTIPTVLAVTATIAATTVMLSMLEGLYGAISQSGRPQNALIFSQGARSGLESTVPLQAMQKIAVLPEIAQGGDAPDLSAELLMKVNIRLATGRFTSATVRGVDTKVFQVHDTVRVKEGVFPERGVRGVVIGRQLVGRYPGFEVGGEIKIGRNGWPVVGIFTAPGTMFESEIWCDRAALMLETNRSDPSMVAVTLSDPQSHASFAAGVKRILEFSLQPMPERAFYQRALEQITTYLKTILVVILLLSLGAIFATTNSMYAAFLGRLRELATLITIGYTRAQVARLLLLENLILSATGGALGLLIGLAFDGRSFGYQEMMLVYSAKLSPRVISAGAISAGVIGLVGGIVTVFQAMRIEILRALRE